MWKYFKEANLENRFLQEKKQIEENLHFHSSRVAASSYWLVMAGLCKQYGGYIHNYILGNYIYQYLRMVWHDVYPDSPL